MGSPFDEAFGPIGTSWEEDSALADALEPGEKVVWTGRPTAWTLVRRSLPVSLIGLVYGGFALFLLLTMRRGGGIGDQHGPFDGPYGRPVFACLMIAATAGGLHMLFGPSWALWRARRTLYALTDRRALIFEPWLLGGRRPDVFTSDLLDLTRCKERDDGSGDLIFDACRRLNWPSGSVGFLGVDRVREVEELLRKTLPPDDRGPAVPSKTVTGIWRLPVFRRDHTGFFFSFFLLWAASWLVVGPVLLAELAHGLVSGRIQFDLIAVASVAAIVVVGLPLCGLAIVKLLAFHKHWFMYPFEIELNDDCTVTFRNWFRTRVVPVAAILSVRSGGWTGLNSNVAVIRHKQGAVSILNGFPDFRDFVSMLKALNPSIDIRFF